MVDRRESMSRERIAEAVVPVSHSNRFMGIQQREAEAEIGWLVASPGRLGGDVYNRDDEISTSSSTSFMTRVKLAGSERNLNSSTLIHERSYILPRDTSKKGIDEFLVNRLREPELYRRIGSISLNEPGLFLFRPIKNDIHGYIETTAMGGDLAIVGLDNYLNNPDGLHTLEESPEEIREVISRTYSRVPNYQEKMINAVERAMKARG